MIKRILHQNVNVTDMERSVKFYRDILGFKVGLHKKGVSSESGEALAFGQTVEAEFYFMTPPGEDDNATFIDLIEYHSPRPIGKPYEHLNNPGIARIAFLVDGIDKMYEYMKGKGMEFLSEPQTLDLRPDVPGLIRLVLFKDSDGTFLELFEYPYEEKSSKEGKPII